MAITVYRIAKSAERAEDLSGFGAYKFGGRWNNKGVYMLYSSMNSSLAYLENMVHFNEIDIPPNLFITTIEIKNDALIYQLPNPEYPVNWQEKECFENKLSGDKWIGENKFLMFKVRSMVNPSEFNFLLNPMFPGYHELLNILSIETIYTDIRFKR